MPAPSSEAPASVCEWLWARLCHVLVVSARVHTAQAALPHLLERVGDIVLTGQVLRTSPMSVLANGSVLANSLPVEVVGMVSGMRASDAEVVLGRTRARRWWVEGRRIRSLPRAAKFIDDVGFALLFPDPHVILPALWDAVADTDAEPFAAGMGQCEGLVWAWKDELPRRGHAWYGKFIRGRASLLSPAMLAALYPGRGEARDHEQLDLSPAAHQIAEALRLGPMSSTALRAAVGSRSGYARAIGELHRQLVVTAAGVDQTGAGWPATMLDLTCRRFPVGGTRDSAYATARFLDTMIKATPTDLARVFGWPLAEARAQFAAAAG